MDVFNLCDLLIVLTSFLFAGLICAGLLALESSEISKRVKNETKTNGES